MERNFGCRILEYSIYGYKAVTVENECLRVSFIVDKGCDIFELLYKKRDIDFMWRSPVGLRSLRDRIGTTYSAQGNFNDYYIGGWQEIFPHGSTADRYRGAEIGFHGEVSLLPWDYMILEDSSECVRVMCSVSLYKFPYIMEKIFTLKKGDPTLYIEEKIMNDSALYLDYMWGTHPAIGGGFLDENCSIILPDCTVINSSKSSIKSRVKDGASGKIQCMPCKMGGVVDLSRIPPYGANISEMLFVKDLESGWYTIRNDALRTEIKFNWDIDIMPYLWLWMEFNGDENFPWYGKAYTLAIEPFSSPVPTITDTIKKGYSSILNPWEQKSFWINVNVSEY